MTTNHRHDVRAEQLIALYLQDKIASTMTSKLPPVTTSQRLVKIGLHVPSQRGDEQRSIPHSYFALALLELRIIVSETTEKSQRQILASGHGFGFD